MENCLNQPGLLHISAPREENPPDFVWPTKHPEKDLEMGLETLPKLRGAYLVSALEAVMSLHSLQEWKP